MLDIQKASAGSGKTYTLAKRYLQYLLFAPDGAGRARLRKKPELEDAVSHILAVTFTNKATAEMKDRIVRRLADLAAPDSNLRTDYMRDFCELTGRSVEEIRKTAATALAILLHNYTDFNVSTIDSFFQTVLRTFAFEVGMNDSYEIELDSDFLARSALDTILSDVNSADCNPQTRKWLHEMMRVGRSKKDRKWNIFYSRSRNSTYDKILHAVKEMSSESFKEKFNTLQKF